MEAMDFIFEDAHTLHSSDLTITWDSEAGEGMSGDYNPDDPDDVQLLRFIVWKDGEPMDDGSYCTLMPVDTDPAILQRGLMLILRATLAESPKRALEEISWMKPEDFDEGVTCGE